MSYLKELRDIVEFLHREGFKSAHNALLQELSARLAGPGPEVEAEALAPPRSSASASAPQSTVGEHEPEDFSPFRSKSAQPGPTWWVGLSGILRLEKSLVKAAVALGSQGPVLHSFKASCASTPFVFCAGRAFRACNPFRRRPPQQAQWRRYQRRTALSRSPSPRAKYPAQPELQLQRAVAGVSHVSGVKGKDVSLTCWHGLLVVSSSTAQPGALLCSVCVSHRACLCPCSMGHRAGRLRGHG
jgi:hypothetical protein